MTDRALLEAAAKAAHIKLDKSGRNGWPSNNDGFDIAGNAVLDWHNGITWNPLTDSADALELAVRLGMQVHVNLDPAGFSAIAVLQSATTGARTYVETDDSDRSASTRRAIVRAAASLSTQQENR